MKIAFLGTPDFVQPIKENLAKNFILVNSFKEADLAVVAAYGHILTKEELNQPRYGCINIHPSLLPKYRGPSPIQTAILNGDKTTGVTIIKMDEKMDHGPILYQESLELSGKDNSQTLSNKLFQAANEVLPQIIEDFVKGKTTPKEQNHTDASFCERLIKESGYFEISNPPRLLSPDGEANGGQASSEILDRMIRAYYPWPGVWTRWNGKIVKFLPGGLVQMEGKKVLSKKDFLNGYPNFPTVSF